MINIFTDRNSHSFNPNEAGHQANETLSEQNSRKMVKKGVILTGGYSDNYCKRPLSSMYFFCFTFICFIDSAVFFTSLGTSLQSSHRLLAGYFQCKIRLIYCMVLLFFIQKGFEAIVMFGGYSDSLVFLLIRFSLHTTAHPEGNRSLANFLKSTVM